MSKRFLRTDTRRFLKFGKRKKSWRTWRKAKGIHSKIRKRRAGYPSRPSIGYATPRKNAGLVKGLKPVLVHNVEELKKADKKSIVILARVGAKKKLEILKLAQEMKLPVLNQGGKK